MIHGKCPVQAVMSVWRMSNFSSVTFIQYLWSATSPCIGFCLHKYNTWTSLLKYMPFAYINTSTLVCTLGREQQYFLNDQLSASLAPPSWHSRSQKKSVVPRPTLERLRCDDSSRGWYGHRYLWSGQPGRSVERSQASGSDKLAGSSKHIWDSALYIPPYG